MEIAAMQGCHAGLLTQGGDSSGPVFAVPRGMVLIIGVLVAGIPLAMIRRRSGGDVDEEVDDEEEAKPARRT